MMMSWEKDLSLISKYLCYVGKASRNSTGRNTLTVCSHRSTEENLLRNRQNIMINQQPTLSVDKMKMTKFGFRMNLLNFSSDLSVFGIFVSIVGVIGGIALFFVASSVDLAYTGLPKLFYAAGTVTLILIIPFLAMWILLKIKTKKQDISGIEKIGKVYSYVSGSLEIIGIIVFIGLVAIVSILDRSDSGNGNSFTNIIFGFMIGLVIGQQFTSSLPA